MKECFKQLASDNVFEFLAKVLRHTNLRSPVPVLSKVLNAFHDSFVSGNLAHFHSNTHNLLLRHHE
jgi:hypothetical protein